MKVQAVAFPTCFTCGKHVFAASRIAQRLTEHGVAVLRFDFTGIGASEGEFANTNFSSNVADLVAATAHLRQAYRAPALLIGHSLGGAAVLAGRPFTIRREFLADAVYAANVIAAWAEPYAIAEVRVGSTRSNTRTPY